MIGNPTANIPQLREKSRPFSVKPEIVHLVFLKKTSLTPVHISNPSSGHIECPEEVPNLWFCSNYVREAHSLGFFLDR